MAGRVRILIAEDDASMRRSIGRFLRAAGFESIEYESAEALLQSADLAPPVCLVTDIQLPGISGLELFDRLLAKDSAVPTVFITAYEDAKRRECILRRPRVAYLAKPFEGAALLEAIRKVTLT